VSINGPCPLYTHYCLSTCDVAETVRAAGVIASAARLRQGADIDADVSLLLQRFVVAEIGHQIEALDAVLAGAPRTPNLHDRAGGQP
jgi:hypothetical protein